jgi:hypothetical protein
MSAPTWLNDLLVIIMLATAAFFVWRMAVASTWRRRVDYPSDAVLALAAVAVAETQVKWLSAPPRPVWAAVFGVAAVYFAYRIYHARRTPADDAKDARNRDAFTAGLSLVLVYMFTAGVAPSTLSGSTAGSVVMAGMPGMMKDTTVRFPTLGLLLAVAAIGYTVVVLDRLSAIRPEPAELKAIDPMDRPGPLPVMAPRTLEAGRIALMLTIAYAILAKLV